MFIILPNEINGFKNVEENYHQIDFDAYLNAQKSLVELYMPKFSFENELSLKTTLQKVNYVHTYFYFLPVSEIKFNFIHYYTFVDEY